MTIQEKLCSGDHDYQDETGFEGMEDAAIDVEDSGWMFLASSLRGILSSNTIDDQDRGISFVFPGKGGWDEFFWRR